MTHTTDPLTAACPQQELAAPLSNALYRVGRAHRLAAGTLLRDLGLYPGQEIMLTHLAEHGDQRQSALVLALSIDPSTVTKMLQRLERGELVARRACPEDKRVSLVTITAQGLALVDRITDCWQRLEEQTTRVLTAQQRDQLGQLLAQIEKNLT
jgi:DNA-binding MarR family transcriptional regulator